MADTDILLSVDLDIKDAEKTAEQLQKEVKNIFDSGRGQKSAALTSLEIQMKKNYDAANHLREGLKALYAEQGKIETFKNMNANAEALEASLGDINAKIREISSQKFDFLGEGRTLQDIQDYGKSLGKSYDEAEDKIKTFEADLSNLRVKELQASEMGDTSNAAYYRSLIDLRTDQLESAKQAFADIEKQVIEFNTELDRVAPAIANTTVEYNGQQVTLKELNTQYEELQETLGRLYAEQAKMKAENPNIEDSAYAESINEAINQTKIQLDKVNDKQKQVLIRYSEIENKGSSGINKATHSMKQLGKATEQVRKSSKDVSTNINVGMRNITKSITRALGKFAMLFLGARGLYSIVMKIRSAILEGFKNLQEAGVGRLKKEMNDLKNASTTLKNALAGAFEPIVTMIIPYIKQLVEWLTIAIDKLAQFIAAMRGQSTYIKAIKQVGNAGEKAKKQLAGFDELNVLNKQGGNGAAGMFEEAAVPQSMFDKIDEFKEKIDAIKDVINENIVQPFKQGFNEAAGDWQTRLDSIKNNMESIGQSLIEIYSSPEVQASMQNFVQTSAETLGQITGATFRIGLNIADNITGGFEQFLRDNKDRIATDISETFDVSSEIVDKTGDLAQAFGEISDTLSTQEAKDFTEALIDLGYTFGSESVQFALKVINDLLALFADPIIDNVDAIRDSFTLLFEDLTPALVIFKDALQQTFDAINQIYDTYIAPILQDAKHLLSELVVSILPIINEIGKIITFLLQIAAVFQEKIQPLVDMVVGVIGPKISFAINLISGVIQAAVKIIVDIIYYLVRFLRAIFEIIYNLLIGDTKGAIEAFLSFWNDTTDRLKESLQWLADLFVEKWEACKQAIEDFKEGIKKPINGVISIFESMINFIINGINSMINTINKVDFKVNNPFTGEDYSIGFNIPNLNTVSLPRLAQGAVIPPNKEFMAVLGDQKSGTNVEAPLETIQQALVNALQEVGFGGGEQPINIYLGGDKIYSEIRKLEKRNLVMGG